MIRTHTPQTPGRALQPWLCLVLCVCLMAACTDIEPLGNSNALTADEQSIGPEGGELIIRGANLFIPPDVFDEPTPVRVARIELPLPLPDFVRPISAVYNITPEDTADVDAPFNFSIVFDGDDNRGNELLLATVEGCDTWILGEAVVGEQLLQGDTLVTTLLKFGTFVVVELDEDQLGAYVDQRINDGLSPACVDDETCFEEVCETGEGEVECSFTPDSGYCGVTGVCLPALECECFVNKECNANSFGCRIPKDFPASCMAGLDTLVDTDDPFEPTDNPMFLNENEDEDDEE